MWINGKNPGFNRLFIKSDRWINFGRDAEEIKKDPLPDPLTHLFR